jgi:hypothetical protein
MRDIRVTVAEWAIRANGVEVLEDGLRLVPKKKR